MLGQGHENPRYEEEKSGYWYTQVPGAPRDIEVTFYTEAGKMIHRQFHGQALRHRTLLNHLQHRWSDVFKRLTVDPHTKTILDERDRNGLIRKLAGTSAFDK